MSDKKTREQILAEIIYREEDNPDFTLNEVLDEIIKGDEYKEPWVDVALEAMQSYAEQHLQDVLGEVEKNIIQNKEEGAILYAQLCEFKSDFPHDFESVKDGFKEGVDFVLNHLKQRKG